MKIYLKQRYQAKQTKFFAALIFILLITGARGPTDTFQSGVCRYTQPTAGMAYSNSISAVSDDRKSRDSLEPGANLKTNFSLLLLWEIGYTLKKSITSFFAKTPKEDILEETFILEAGIRQKLSDTTVPTALTIPELPIPNNEVWNDPFLPGSDRPKKQRNQSRASNFLQPGSPVTDWIYRYCNWMRPFTWRRPYMRFRWAKVL